MGRGSIPAVELLAQLADDPDYQRRAAERSREFERLAAERQHKRAAFDADIQKLGIETVDRSTGLRSADAKVIEVVTNHLSRRGYDDETREAIARALEAKDAWPHWELIRRLYLEAQGPREREALAAALSVSAKAQHVPAMKDLVQDAALGVSRIFFLRPINRLDRTHGRDFVIDYLDDPDIGKEADAIRRRRSRSS